MFTVAGLFPLKPVMLLIPDNITYYHPKFYVIVLIFNTI